MRLITCALLLCAVIMIHIPNLCDSGQVLSYDEDRSGGTSDVKITVNRHVTVEGDASKLNLIRNLQKSGVLSLTHSLELGGSSHRNKHVHSSSRTKKKHCKRCHGKHSTDWSRRRFRKRVESMICPGVVSYTTDDFRRVVLDTHNRFRSDLALGNVFSERSGKTLRKANSMLRLNYDCASDHRTLTDINCHHPPRKLVPGYCDPAVNVYWSNSRDPITAVKQAMHFWWDDLQRTGRIEQIQNLFYSHSGICNMAPMGSDLTTDVACGTDDCGDKTLVVCRYSFIKKLKNGMKWYSMGPTCKQCQRRWGARGCQDGLCV